MQEIPLPLVRSNQVGIVIVALLAIFLQWPWLIMTLWLIQLLGLLFGLRFNAFVALARPWLRTQDSDTQHVELARFNNILALIFLTASMIALAFQNFIVAYVFVGMLACAAFLAICGFCIGCLIYFQLKQRLHRFR
jgi:hypothetical protein